MDSLIRKIFPKNKQKMLVNSLIQIIEPFLAVKKVEILRDQINLFGSPKSLSNNFYFEIQDELLKAGFFSNVSSDKNSENLKIEIYLSEALESHKTAQKPEKIGLNFLLFFLTILTTLFAGASFETDWEIILQNPVLMLKGVPFSFGVIAILLSHELGHYFLAVYHKVPSTLPFFIPMPVGFIGTLGAFIKMRARIETRKKLLDIGAGGPIAGFLVAIPILIYGIYTSELIPISNETDRFLGAALVKMTFERDVTLSIGEPLLIFFFKTLIFGQTQNAVLSLNGLAFAGWVGLLVTSYNLMPVGQLDGGHILYATFPKYHKIVANLFWLSLIALGYFTGFYGWFVWATLLFFMKLTHPAIIDYKPLCRDRKLIALVSLLIFVLCFTPVPIELNF
ncbi:site-2 protease family protein [bacterium]|nr:site-2 protease family protein [bacterium]